MEIRPELNADSRLPIYRQLGEYLQNLIESGSLRPGEKLPPTRELAGHLGLNRTTVSAAYEMLETSGLIHGEVGRGSFVRSAPTKEPDGLNWSHALAQSPTASVAAGSRGNLINFSSSRPSERQFPVEEFRACCREVLASAEMRSLMQLGSPAGYAPLREYLLQRSDVARDTDDILITNGCQQAVDLLSRALVKPRMKVAVEEPVYPGLKNLFLEAGAELIGVEVGASGAEPYSLRRALDQGAKLVVLTPSFQNPTGATIPDSARRQILAMVRAAGAILIENDIYSELQYSGPETTRLKALEPNVILLGSFSKIAFPGVRCGWILAPKPVIARVTEFKQLSDLHTDQLSQAFLLRFAESGELAAHQKRMVAAGREKLRAVSEAARQHLEGCTFTIPDGGMNLWVDLGSDGADGLDAAALRGLAQRAGVDYMPGRQFSVTRALDSGLRLSFVGLEVNEIRLGIELLGSVVREARMSRTGALAPAGWV